MPFLSPTAQPEGQYADVKTIVDDDYTVLATDAGKLIVMDSSTDRTVTLPVASVLSAENEPVTILRKGTGLVTITSASTLYPSPSKIRNQHGTAVVRPISASEYEIKHDGLAGSIWEMQ